MFDQSYVSRAHGRPYTPIIEYRYAPFNLFGAAFSGKFRESNSGVLHSRRHKRAGCLPVNASATGLSLGEIASATGLKATTAHNLARTLVHKGYLSKLARPVRFQTGPAVTALIQDHCRDSLLERAATALREFCARFPTAP